MKKSKKLISIIFVLFFLISVAGCVAGPNDLVNIPNDEEYLAGFFMGVWHGMILLFTFIISLFKDNVSVYEVHNSGALYNLGYLIGVSIFFSGSGSASKKSRKKR